MTWLRNLLCRLFRPRVRWDELHYGKPATVDDEQQRLNGEL
jgi:hypothetical protein